MIRSKWAVVLLLAWGVVLAPVGLQAQSVYGEIRGTVTDPSGAVISGAAVTVTHVDTGEARKVQTDAAGNYQAVNLEAGVYEVAIENSGFRKSVTQNVALRAREVARVDVRLEIAAAAAEVVVLTSRQVIQTDIATIVDSKSSQELMNAAINMRAAGTNTIFPAISLAPGVQTNSTGGEMSLAGSMPFMATASVDGISIINVRSNGILAEMFPSAETIDELKVSSISNNAEFAQVGDVTATSKGGSNALHGSLFWYHQNGAFDARDTFTTRSVPFRIVNDFGFHAGGPVIKNKTFFFGAYEALRYHAQSQINVTVPPDNFRTGNLRSVPAGIRDPLSSGQVFSNNVIPASRISSVSAKVLERLYPRQNQATGDSTADLNYRLTSAQTNRNDQFDVRGDHVFNDQQNIFVRYSFKDVTRQSPTVFPATLGDDLNYEESRNLAFAHNYIIRPTLVNEFRFGYANRPRGVDFGPGGKSFDGPALVKDLGIQGLRPDPPKVASVPDFGITGFQGTAKSRGFTQLSRALQFSNNLTWTKGRHTFKFGADVRRLRTTDNVSFFSGDDLGEYRFNGAYSGNPMADFLLGYPNRTRFANTGPDIDGHTYHQGYFAQDDWKVTSKLTVNYGMRYEYHPPFYDDTLQLANFDRDFPGGRVVVPNEKSLALTAPAFRASIGSTPIVTAKDAGWPAALRYGDKNNFAPRIGFAYRPWGNRTVIRGGYGIYSVTVLGAVFYSLVGIHTSDTRTFNNQLVNNVPQLAFPNPFGAGIGAVSAVGSADFRRGNELRAPDPYAQQWNFTVERDLGWNTGLRVTYTGSHSIKLFSSPDLNQVRPNTAGYSVARNSRPYPNWAIVYSRDTGPSAKYNAMITEVQKRFSDGLSLQSSWAWSKNLSNATGSNSTGFAAENGSVPTDRYNLEIDYGNVSPTRRHRWLTNLTYEFPFGKGKKFLTDAHPAVDALLGGWQLGGIMILQTGPFLTPITGGRTDPSGTNVDSRANDRPDYTGANLGNIPEGQRSILRWFDNTAFSTPPNNIGRFGLVGPGRLVGPGTKNFSANLRKKFRVREGCMLQADGSFSNLFNHPNYGIPFLNLSETRFGRITSTQGAEQGGSRTIQVGLRLTF